MTKPTLCVDFDGVIHSYTSGWQGADVVLDPPVPGALEFLRTASEHFDVCIYSSRSHEPGGSRAMQDWMVHHGFDPDFVHFTLFWPRHKPSAFLTIDDRALTFTGTWPDPAQLLEFKPWNKGGQTL